MLGNHNVIENKWSLSNIAYSNFKLGTILPILIILL